MKIYVAGRIRKVHLSNFPMFDYVSDSLRENRWTVINPADLNREHGFTEDYELSEADLRFVFSNDFHELCYCDAIMLLPGWEKSEGAFIEFQIAKLLGLSIHYWDPMKVPFPALDVAI